MSVAEMANPVAAAAAAEDLLKPEKVEEEEEKDADEGGDDDELEALRLAALNSIRPKKKVEVPPPQPSTGFELKKHPVRNNLVAIVIPSEDDQVPALNHATQSIPFVYSLTKRYLNYPRRRSKTNLRGMKSRRPVRRTTRWT